VTPVISSTSPLVKTVKERADQPGDFVTRILLQEVPARDQMRAFGMGQQLLEPAGKRRSVENFILTTPDD
jgi:hypothetical protein